jgi:modulator of FtsH protease HflK
VARLDRKPAEHVALAGLIVSAIGGILCLVVTMTSGCSSAWVLTWQLLVGTLVWIITLMRLRQTRLAEEEQGEWERLQAERAQGGARGRLFDEDEIQAFSARNRLRILDKYVTPGFSLLIGLGLIVVVALTLLSRIIQRMAIHPTPLVFLLFFAFSVVTFVFFLLSRYAAGMSRQIEWRPLRAAAGCMMANTIFAACAVAAFATTQLEFGRWDDVLAYCMLAVMGILAIELILNFVLDFYRPRVEGVEERPAYDSRLMGLLLTPAGLFKTVSATLDYQFGFRVSQTWIYRFTEQWIAPLILFDLVTLYLLTSFVVVGAEQKGVLERRGVYQHVLDPGIHFKLPWPIERVYRFPANEVKTITLGHSGAETETDKILWTNKHYEKEFNVMVARRESDKNVSEKEVPVNLLVATTTIRYRITDVYKWYYSSPEPEKLLEALCEREQVKYLAGVDLFEVMSIAREQAAKDLQARMQQAADNVPTNQKDVGLGAQIIAVGVEGMHPPVEPGVPEAFHGVIDAMTEVETTRLQAEQTAVKTLSEAKSGADVVKLNAQSYYATRVAVAEAEAKRFDAQNTAYGTAAGVFKAREYFSALEKGLQDPAASTADQKEEVPRKIVVGVKGMDQRIRVNLEDPVGTDIGQIEFNKPE